MTPKQTITYSQAIDHDTQTRLFAALGAFDTKAWHDVLCSLKPVHRFAALMAAIEADVEQAVGASLAMVDDTNIVIDGWTALASAVNIGNTSIVQRLLEHWANPNMIPCNGWNAPLPIAIVQQRQDLVALLLSSGADITTKLCVAGQSLDILAFAVAHGQRRELALIEQARFERDTARPKGAGCSPGRL